MTSRTRRAVPKPPRHADPRGAPTPLRDEQLRQVVGGRKAGKGQLEYYRVVLSDLLISAF
jgi:hypothetical protein